MGINKLRNVLTDLFAINPVNKSLENYNASGLWRGTLMQHRVALLNREDGTSRLYFGYNTLNAAGGYVKLEGYHRVSGNAFEVIFNLEGVTNLELRSTMTSSGVIAGYSIFQGGEPENFLLTRYVRSVQ